MSTALQNIVEQYSDLLLKVLELKDNTILADVLFSIEDTHTLINKGLLR
jgi:hypothetical protein